MLLCHITNIKSEKCSLLIAATLYTEKHARRRNEVTSGEVPFQIATADANNYEA